MLFTVLPNGRRAPTGSRLRAFLLTDDWDDWFTYSVVFQQKGQQAGYVGCGIECVQALSGGELEELSHGLPER
jgi:hypothetical protein